MKKRLPNTDIYLDTSDFSFSSNPEETNINISDRFIVSSNPDGSLKEQTIKGDLSVTNSFTCDSLTCNSFTITTSEITLAKLNITNYINFYSNTKLYTYRIWSHYNSSDTQEEKYAKIELSGYTDNSHPSSIQYIIPYRSSNNTLYTVAYIMDKDGFYYTCSDNNYFGSLGTNNNPWSNAYINTGNITNLNNVLSINADSYSSSIGGFGSISSKLFKGCVESLYSKDSTHHTSDPGSLFIANSYPPNAGSMTIRFKQIRTSSIDQNTAIQEIKTAFGIDDNPNHFAKRIRIRRGVLDQYNDSSINNIDIVRYSVNAWEKDDIFTVTCKEDPYYGYYYKLETSTGLVVSFYLSFIRSNPLLYNSGSPGVPPVIYNDEYWCHDDCIDINRWYKISFLNEVLFELPNIENLYYTFSSYFSYAEFNFEWSYTLPSGKSYAEVESTDKTYSRSVLVMRVS